MLGEGEDLGECAGEGDVALAAGLARIDVDAVDQGADDLDRLAARGLVRKEVLEGGDLSAVQVGKVRMEVDHGLALSDKSASVCVGSEVVTENRTVG